MGKVIAGATVSLDGFIADESDRVGPLFDWYGNGDVPFNGGDPERVFHVSAASHTGCRQVVLLAAGLDAQAFRLPWPAKTRLFEVDLPDVTVRAPNTRLVAFDLR